MLHRAWPADGKTPSVPLPGPLAESVAAKLAASSLADPDFCSRSFFGTVEGYLDKMMGAYREARQRCGLADDDVGGLVEEELAGQASMTEAQLDVFLRECVTRYQRKRVDPGSTVRAPLLSRALFS